ncbi:MAG: hypothetical protein V7L20_18040 [Nostoc sp.]|uniref:hypothetical protein n=1 Tax=Nostoc sp. TaxID=1180 RepID=UPI002FF6491D
MASINGTLGNDNLTGTPETDSIFGDLGDDTLNGFGGDDEFVFNNVIDKFFVLDDLYVYSSDGFDIIKNFSSGKIININPVNHYYEHVKINYDPGFINIGLGATSTKGFRYDRNTGALSFQGTKFATLENKPNFIPSLDIELVKTHVNTNNVDTGVKINYDADSIIRLGATSTKEFSYNLNTSALCFQETQFATLENKPNFIPSLDGLTS